MTMHPEDPLAVQHHFSSHKETPNDPVRLNSVIDVSEENAGIPVDVDEDTIDSAYLKYMEAGNQLALLMAARAAAAVRSHLPAARVIVLREDTSHLPAHGHVDDILDWEGKTLLNDDTHWHDLEWTAEIDDDIYEIYDLVSHRFAAEADWVRRLRIVI